MLGWILLGVVVFGSAGSGAVLALWWSGRSELDRLRALWEGMGGEHPNCIECTYRNPPRIPPHGHAESQICGPADGGIRAESAVDTYVPLWRRGGSDTRPL